ncbi:hypothetical protein ABKV19_000613 [Rosa sericea]
MFDQHLLVMIQGSPLKNSLSSVQLIERPFTLLEEEPQSRRQNPILRVEKIKLSFRVHLTSFSAFYQRGKILIFMSLRIVTQIILPSKIYDQYLTNVLLKINSKLDDSRKSKFETFDNFKSLN